MEIKFTFDFDPFANASVPAEARYEVSGHAVQVIDTTPVFHAIWQEIHTKEQPDEKWWESIRERIRKLVCKCDAFLDDYLADHPLNFKDWPRWTWALHNAINKKLGKPKFSWKEFRAVFPRKR